MTRDEKIAKARELHAAGWSYRQIGDLFGCTHSAVWKWFNAEEVAAWAKADNARRHEEKKAWRRIADRTPEGRGTCGECGGLLGIGQARRGGRTCEECIQFAAVQKLVRLERLWNEGKTFPEICAAFGWSRGHLSQMLDRGRERGYDLPYRRVGPRQPGKHPELRPDRQAAA